MVGQCGTVRRREVWLTDGGREPRPVVNCDGLHTVSRCRLTHRLGSVAVDSLEEVRDALSIALGCDRHRPGSVDPATGPRTHCAA